jgi:hypothetical protein
MFENNSENQENIRKSVNTDKYEYPEIVKNNIDSLNNDDVYKNIKIPEEKNEKNIMKERRSQRIRSNKIVTPTPKPGVVVGGIEMKNKEKMLKLKDHKIKKEELNVSNRISDEYDRRNEVEGGGGSELEPGLGFGSDFSMMVGIMYILFYHFCFYLFVSIQLLVLAFI